MTSVFFGYPGQIWQVCYQSLAWLSGRMNGGAAPAQTQASSASTVFQTLYNAVGALDAWQAGTALQAELTALAAIEALSLSLDPTTSAYFSNRITGYTVAASGITSLPPAVSVANLSAQLAAGTPAVAYAGYLEWCAGYAGEPAPAGLTATTLPADTLAAATAWQTVAAAVSTAQGGPVTQAYDTATRVARTTLVIANIVNDLTSGPFAPIVAPNATWSGIAALPAILLDAASLNCAPFSPQNQQCGVIRYALLNMLSQLSLFLLSLRRPATGTVNLATLRLDDTLLDVAARSLGNFEQWTAIAALNGLLPPYPSPDNVARAGTQVLLPGSTGTVASGSPVASYSAYVLGTDYDFGPLNGAQPAWTGDYQLITGLLNYARSIGRRLQTPIGSLIYHPSYGSRIPPEVGAIQSADEAARLAAYGQSAIASDPRTAKVISATATLEPGFLASFSAVAQPIGPGVSPVSLNETISPLP